jgi:single-strand DNA-binding protein
MANFNKVILVGNLTRDPEMRVTPQGLSIGKLALAINRSYRSASGEEQKETTYVDVDVFGKQAEVISKYMAKGRAIMVEGRLKTDSWTSQSGEKRSKLVVVLENFQFMGGGRGEEGGEGGGRSSGYQSVPASTSSASQSADAGDYGSRDMDEDIPF